jgi:gluconokinase
MNPCVLAIDIGTSSTRAIVFDAAGSAVEGLRAQAVCAPRTEPPGASEFDADALVEAAAGCVDTVLREARAQKVPIAAVGVCAFWHSMVGVDAAGRAVTPLYTWADTRAGDAARRLREQLDPDAVHARTGCALHPSYLPARLLWLSETEPELFRRAVCWLSPGEYLFLRLFGEPHCSVSMASATGLFHQNACDWDEEMLAALPIGRENLPILEPPPGPLLRKEGERAPSPYKEEGRGGVYGLRPGWTARWPELSGVPWIPALGDGAASNAGSGCATDRRIAVNLGTSGAIRVLWRAERVEIPPELWCYRMDRERFVMGGAFSDGGAAYAWARDTLTLPDAGEIERRLGTRPPDAHGLTFLPFLAGERSVGWRPEARATLHGLNAGTTSLDIMQAVMEAVALRFMLVAEALQRHFPSAREIVASGRALAQSPVWARMLADALGRPITLLEECEASSRGAALAALREIGLLQNEADAPLPTGRLIAPSPDRHEIFQRALARQQELYRRML